MRSFSVKILTCRSAGGVGDGGAGAGRRGRSAQPAPRSALSGSRGAGSSPNLFTGVLIQKINACFCLFAGIRPREALPAAASFGKIQLELALGFLVIF